MKPYLVDVPVLVFIWTRTECQREQFEVIKKARPSIIFVASDGGRNEEEWAAINQNRAIFENEIDWDCQIYRLYMDTNQGLYAMSAKVRELVWSKVDRCILLEDDIIPSVSFFQYCEELLEKYKNDERIELICGMNHLGISENVTSDYFFSCQSSIWGVATWKRVETQNREFYYDKDEYTMNLLKSKTKKNKPIWEKISAYSENDRYEGHVAGPEFWYSFDVYSQNRVHIVPKYNMISNIGCTSNATHGDTISQMPRGLRRIFNMKIYEIDFPLKHPDYVIPDVDYERKRNRIMGHGRPLIKLYRKIERLFLKLASGDIKYILKKIQIKKNGEN